MNKNFQKTIEKLEFQKVVSNLREYASSDLSKDFINNLKPKFDKEHIQHLQDETADSLKLIRTRGGIPIANYQNIKPHLKRLTIDADLSGKEIAEIGKVLSVSREIYDYFEDMKEEEVELERLYAIQEQLADLGSIERRIYQTIDQTGYVVDEASSKLKGIRQGIKTTERAVRDKLNEITRGSQSKYLTDSIITMRNDRFVIPVKAESKGVFKGIVHDQSSTGQTLFVEPQSVLNLNNRLKQYQSEEKNEVAAILRELSGMLAPQVPVIENNLKLLVRFDFINAKGRYANDLNATKPSISTENIVDLVEARHPLIDKDVVVANDIVIGGDYKTIVITGPNTGGKTVVLKTLGLIQLMGQVGLHIPTESGSQIGIYKGIYADIGDEQSIEQNLSTFSSHMTNITGILQAIDEESLVLLDELGAGTDPQEGAALAISILDFISSKGSHVMLTSHYPELKAYGYNRPETVNASMEFNIDTLSPTYRLLIGVPGRSNAFEITQRLGMDDQIIEGARQLMTSESQSVDGMIEDLESKRKEAEESSIELSKELNKATMLHNELKQFHQDYLDHKDQLEKEAKEEANKVVEKAEKKADQIIKDLRQKQLESNQASTVKEHEFIDAKSRLNNMKHEEQHLEKNKVLKKAKEAKEFAVGDEVKVKSINQMGILVEKIGNKEWTVQMGMLKMKIKESDLELQQKGQQSEQKSTPVRSTSRRNIKTEIDLRGERVDDAINRLDKYIDEALLANLTQINIITGLGTGAVRKGVWDYLKKHSKVQNYQTAPANQGGSGATIATLK